MRDVYALYKRGVKMFPTRFQKGIESYVNDRSHLNHFNII